jgi:hypothetical protein
MSIDIAINNVGEYFSAQYLADSKGFIKDIKVKSDAWKTQGSQSAPRKLQALGEGYFKAKAKALDYPEPLLRSQANEAVIDSWHYQILEALGYQPVAQSIELLSEGKQIPVMLRLNRNSQPWLVIAQTPFCLNSGDHIEDPLEEMVEPSSKIVEDLPTFVEQWEHAIAVLLKQENHPRWVMLLAGSRIYLFDAHTYAQGRYLYVDLDEAYGRKDIATFSATAALLSKEALAPESETDEVLHEKLREGSLKATHGVSAKLQSAVREAIELIANGWVDARRAQGNGYKQLGEQEQPLADGSREVHAEQLKHDALVYVYRILFCLYGEARGGELGILPISDDVYRLGYSIEALRDLADRGEPSTQSESGRYYAEHLTRLFRLVHQGFHPDADDKKTSTSSELTNFHGNQVDLFGQGQTDMFSQGKVSTTKSGNQIKTGTHKTFVIQPLTATLFDPKTTPLLDRVKLSNKVLQQVIRRLSLGTGSSNKQIDRINYAELGIVQLGSVYEGLLSYKGFFAKEELIQVTQAENKKKVKGKNAQPLVYDDAIDPKKATWFVPSARETEFKEGEIIIEGNTEKARKYAPGTFILHLNGVDRVNSASYYTPEVLTRCLVKEALKERLKDFGPEQADEILELKICEPAMGSAAFLVEAIDQLARHYLVLKQEQINESIDPSAFEEELGRVKHYIAVRNVYGVDLNPTAVELGSLSLWLASIHRLKVQTGENGAPDVYQPGQTPWFGLRLRAGNSLIGARRAVWTHEQLINGINLGKNAAAPRQLKPGEQRAEKEIYHFLVWDEDMAPAARDKLMKQHWPEDCLAINDWNKNQVKQKWSPEELAIGRDISNKIDELWQDYAQYRIIGLDKTQCTASVWPLAGNDEVALKKGPSLEYQEGLKDSLEAQSGAFQRLKLLMDSWCSFYFWPLQKSSELPSRSAWLAAAEVLLGTDKVNDDSSRHMLDITLGDEIKLEELFAESQQQLPDATKLAASVPWFAVARDVDTSQNFHHWELIFTEILGPKFEEQETEPKGFDLMFGNPPWMKVTWNDATLLSEMEPLLGVRDAKSAKYSAERPKLLAGDIQRIIYRDTYEQGAGSLMFLNDRTLYPALAGVQTNLYKNFIERSWDLLVGNGIAGLLHPEGVFDDPRGGVFRGQYYKRLKSHYQLKNELVLFADVDHHMAFSINTYQGALSEINFKVLFNVFSPSTIAPCFQTEILNSEIPGIKNKAGQWETLGHPQRLINITESELVLFAKLFEDDDTSFSEARLPQVHSKPLMEVLEKFSKSPRRLSSHKGEYLASELLHEVTAQRDGFITRVDNPSFIPSSSDEWVLSGPHIFCGTPFNKTPRSICVANGHYDQVDLGKIENNYFPRAVYRLGDKEGSLKAFESSIAEWPRPSKPYKDSKGIWVSGFLPVENELVPAFELLLGESLILYGIDKNLPGAKTAREFGCFSEWLGDVHGAVYWLCSNNLQVNSVEYLEKYGEVRCKQKIPENGDALVPKPQTFYAKYALRAMCQPANERTLIGSLVPHGTIGINSIRFVMFTDDEKLLSFSSFSNSIVADFFMKVKGRSNIHEDDIGQLPLLNGAAIELANNRTLRLSSLTEAYSHIWNKLYKPTLNDDSFCLPGINNTSEAGWSELTNTWDKSYALRTDFLRRQASLEIDVLAAIALGLKIEQLIQLYTVQFPIMKTYDEIDQYDSKGRRLPNTTRKDAGAKELREELIDHDGNTFVTVNWEIDNGNQAVTKTFYPPFKHVDRIEDYKTAYRVFSARLGIDTSKF